MNQHLNQTPARRRARTTGRRRALTTTAVAGALVATATAVTTVGGTALAGPKIEQVATALGAMQYDPTPGCGAEVAYRDDRILASTTAPAQVVKRINSFFGIPKGAPGAVVSDVLTFPDVTGIAPVYEFDLPGSGAQKIVDLARHLRSTGIEAAPNYVTKLAGGKDFFQPNGLPVATTEVPVPRDAGLGKDVQVVVFDSGLAPTTMPALIPNVRPASSGDVEDPDADGDGAADQGWVGHGLAISSEMAALAPAASIVDVAITVDGIATDLTAARAIVEYIGPMAPGQLPEVLIASFGTLACDLDPAKGTELYPVALAGAVELVDSYGSNVDSDMVMIASAGNHGTTRRMYPAAFPDAVAVGALDATADGDASPLTSPSRTAPVALFSGRGDWVDFYAPGVDIVTLHVDGLTFDNGETIRGSALVEGTSFSAPYFGAQVAELMSAHHISAEAAIDELALSGNDPMTPCDGSTDPLGPGAATALVGLRAASDETAVDLPKARC